MDLSDVEVQGVLHAVGEPTRFRILELLAQRPHTVGEVAASLGALQPQTTKHLQTLESAGVIQVHRLGRRRVARLDRDTLTRLAAYFGKLAEAGPDDAVLEAYQSAIAVEEQRPSRDGVRVLRFERTLPADPDSVWAAWTDPAQAAAWWAPRHFSVTAFELAPRAGAPVRVALREGDGAEYESRGRVEEVGPGRLVFTLAPVGPGGEPLFRARHTLTISGKKHARLGLVIEVSGAGADAAPAIAGLEPGWHQLLDGLAAHLRTSARG